MSTANAMAKSSTHAEPVHEMRYALASTPLYRFLGDGMVEVHTTKKLLVPREAFDVLMLFAEPLTVAAEPRRR